MQKVIIGVEESIIISLIIIIVYKCLDFSHAHTCTYSIGAELNKEKSKDKMRVHGLVLVEKVNGCARPSETRVNHPQKRRDNRLNALLTSE